MSGVLLLLKVKSFFLNVITVFRVEHLRMRKTKMIKIGSIQYTGDIARIELLLPKYLGEWLEKQSKMQKVSASVFIKTLLLRIYNNAAQHVTK